MKCNNYWYYPMSGLKSVFQHENELVLPHITRAFQKIWSLSDHISRALRKIWSLSDHISRAFQKIWSLLTHISRALQKIWSLSYHISRALQKIQYLLSHISRAFQKIWSLLDHISKALQKIQSLLTHISRAFQKIWSLITHISRTLQKIWSLSLQIIIRNSNYQTLLFGGLTVSEYLLYDVPKVLNFSFLSWKLNIQHELGRRFDLTTLYFRNRKTYPPHSKGNLKLRRVKYLKIADMIFYDMIYSTINFMVYQLSLLIVPICQKILFDFES